MQNMIKGLHDRLMESQAETKKEKEKSKIIVTPKKDESLMETIQLFLKISQERKETAKEADKKRDDDQSGEKPEEASDKDATDAIKAAADDSKSPVPPPPPPIDEEMQQLREKLTLLTEKHLKDAEEKAVEAAAPPASRPTPSTTPDSGATKIDGKLAQIIGIVSCFLNVHPHGASMAYIWSYLKQMENTTLGLRCVLHLLEIRPNVGHGGAVWVDVEKARHNADDLSQFAVDLRGARVRRG